MSYYELYEIIDELKETTSSNKKIEILTMHKDKKTNGHLAEVLELAYSPFIQFYIKKIPEYKQAEHSTMLFNVALAKIKQISTRAVTGDKAKLLLTQLLETLSPKESALLESIILKDLRCGISAKTINKVFPNLIKVFPVMLCSSHSEKNLESITYPAFIQTKMDGANYTAIVTKNGVEFRSRNGKPLIINSAMTKQIETLSGGLDNVFNGELIVLDKHGNLLPRTKGNGVLNHIAKGIATQEEVDSVRYVIWDVIPLTDFYNESSEIAYAQRYDWLNTRFDTVECTMIKLVKTEIVQNIHQAMDFYKNELKAGEEGAILKNFGGTWENKRSKNQVKLKVVANADLKIIGMEEGEGKHKGRLGAFVCTSSDSKVMVRVGTGFTDKQRNEYWEQNLTGNIVEIKFNDIVESESKDGHSLFLPVFVELRSDKDVADSLEKIRSELNG